MRSIARILSCLALILALAVPALQAAPKQAKTKAEPTNSSVANVDTDWHLGIVGGLTIPTGTLSNDPEGQTTGYNGGLYLEKDLDHEFTLNLGLDFHLLDNHTPNPFLSPLMVLEPTLNLKWNLINDSMKIYWLGGMSYSSQGFTADSGNGATTTLSTWNFGLRTGLGLELPLGPSDAIVADFLWDILFSVPESIFVPLRVGYEFKL